jgi:hypothetical protein
MPPRGQQPSGSQKYLDRDRILQSLVQAIRHTPRGIRTHRTPPVASRETHPKMSNSKIPHRLIKVLGLGSHSRQVLSTVKQLTNNSHRTGARIPCSYHMSNPVKEIL